MQRFVVLEGPASADYDAVVSGLRDEGMSPVTGWRVPAGADPASVVCVGRVATAQEASRAVLAAISGAHLVVIVAAMREVADALCDDLRRLGAVDHRLQAGVAPILSGDERKLLSLLLGGATLGEAARALHLSRRTADRRLASARAVLRAGSTPEALSRALELGVRPT